MTHLSSRTHRSNKSMASLVNSLSFPDNSDRSSQAVASSKSGIVGHSTESEHGRAKAANPASCPVDQDDAKPPFLQPMLLEADGNEADGNDNLFYPDNNDDGSSIPSKDTAKLVQHQSGHKHARDDSNFEFPKQYLFIMNPTQLNPNASMITGMTGSSSNMPDQQEHQSELFNVGLVPNTNCPTVFAIPPSLTTECFHLSGVSH